LAAIAIPNFLRFQLKAKSSEGKTNLAAIRTAEESYYAEFGVYVSSNASPATIGKNQKTSFTNTDGGNKGFDRLGWSPEGMVFFNYAVGKNTGASQFTATASADIDDDSTNQVWGYKKGGTAAKTHVCTLTELQPETVGPCLSTFGQSVF
jgi:type IV pilus assembly protein PilA